VTSTRAPAPACPICKGAAKPATENPAFPFCSRRCQLADLGSWLDERYRIPAEDVTPDDDPDRRDR